MALVSPLRKVTIRKNISVFYDEFSVFLENLRFVAASLPKCIKDFKLC